MCLHILLSIFMVLALWGCATPEPVKVTPAKEIKSSFYVGAMELTLKKAADSQSADAARLTLNEQVELVEKGPAGWLLVRATDGRQGWANEKYLNLRPLSDFYVRRWGTLLRGTPEDRGKTLAKLRLNDQVRLLNLNAQGWAQVEVGRIQNTGWVELKNLSTGKVVVRRRPATPSKAGEKATVPEAAEAPGEEPAPEASPPPPSLIGPTPAEAAPPPVKKEPVRPKVRPDIFEPF